MRVVLDTNIIVSACWKPGGLEAIIVDLTINGKLIPCISAEILAEYRDVLSRPKLAALSARADALLTKLEHAAVFIETAARVTACTDDDDNRFLECAEAARAEYLITGNLRHYPATWAGTQIVNSRTFLSQPNINAIPLQ